MVNYLINYQGYNCDDERDGEKQVEPRHRPATPQRSDQKSGTERNSKRDFIFLVRKLLDNLFLPSEKSSDSMSESLNFVL